MRLTALAAFVLLAVAACGEEKENEQAGRACGPPPAAMSASPTLLPTDFPTPSRVTYTSEKSAGPAKIVTGYLDDDVDAAFDAYKEALGAGGYSVTKSEHEHVDAEVNFAGGSSTGQVKLLQECKDRTTVRITARPA